MNGNLIDLGEENSEVQFWTICQNIYFVQSIVIWVKLKNHKHLKMMNRFNFLSKNFKIFYILEHIIASKSCHLGSTTLMVRVPTGPILTNIRGWTRVCTLKSARFYYDLFSPEAYVVLARVTLLWTSVI